MLDAQGRMDVFNARDSLSMFCWATFLGVLGVDASRSSWRAAGRITVSLLAFLLRLSASGYLKLIDFGIAKKLEEGKTRTFTMPLGRS